MLYSCIAIGAGTLRDTKRVKRRTCSRASCRGRSPSVSKHGSSLVAEETHGSQRVQLLLSRRSAAPADYAVGSGSVGGRLPSTFTSRQDLTKTSCTSLSSIRR